MKITIVRGDITVFDVDAIVNAANRSLLGGGGVDGAIHRAAGPELLDECLKIRKEELIKGLPTGQVVLTKGYNLAAKNIIHTVGPINGKDDIMLLKDCYINSLRLAEKNNFKTIAFPSISTGSYGMSIIEAVKIVKDVLKNFETSIIEEVILVLHSQADYAIYTSEFYNQ